MPATPTSKTSRRPPGPGRWRLQDAKAQFSELVRRAREKGPQPAALFRRSRHGSEKPSFVGDANYHVDCLRALASAKVVQDIINVIYDGLRPHDSTKCPDDGTAL